MLAFRVRNNGLNAYVILILIIPFSALCKSKTTVGRRGYKPQRIHIRYQKGSQLVPGDIEGITLVITKENYKGKCRRYYNSSSSCSSCSFCNGLVTDLRQSDMH